MNGLRAIGRVLRDLLELTLIQPIRDGRMRTANWPAGLVTIAIGSAAMYALVALAVIFAGALRTSQPLIIANSNRSLPEPAVGVLLAGLLLSLVLIQTAALHLHPVLKVGSLVFTAVVLTNFLLATATDTVGWALIGAGFLGNVALMIARRRREFVWWEFAVVAVLLGMATLGPLLVGTAARNVGSDLRGRILEGALTTLNTLSMPAVFVAGAALAQIAVSAAQAGVQASQRELSPVMLRIAGALLAVWAIGEVARRILDLSSASVVPVVPGILASLMQLGLVVAAVAAVLRNQSVPDPTEVTADSTTINYLLALGTSLHVVVATPVAFVREVARRLGPEPLFQLTNAYLEALVSSWINPTVRLIIGVAALLYAFRLARLGRTVHATLLACFFALTLLGALALLPVLDFTRETSSDGVALLALIFGVAVAAWQLLAGTLTVRRGLALASVLLLCLIFPHRAFLDDPVSALLGFTGIGAILFGLIWRALTEGDITHQGTRRFPVPARALVFCGNGLLAVTAMAFVALSRSSGSYLDLARFAEVGDLYLGTPLFLAAIAIGFATALVPPGTSVSAADQQRVGQSG